LSSRRTRPRRSGSWRAGRADLAISYEPELLLARDKGADLVSVGALVQKPLTSLMSLGAHGDQRARAARGKRVGTAGHPVPVGAT
jgi:putative hydroxymethylpyrimidine transport system substrate-binding protein